MHFIEFPRLGLRFDINPEIFTIGEVTIHWYGVIIALAFLAAVLGALRSSEKQGISQDNLIDMILYTIPVAIILARLYFVFMNWSYYSLNLSEIFKVWHGGIAIYGGIFGGILTIIVFCKTKKISAFKMLDHVVIYMVLAQSIGRWGNFVNQELYGIRTTLPWGMTGDIIQFQTANTATVHPVFLYESI